MVTLSLWREQAAILQDILTDARAAATRAILDHPEGSPERARAGIKAVEVGQVLHALTVARAEQDEDSGIGPLHRSVA